MEDLKITYKDKKNSQTLYQSETFDEFLVRAKDLNEIKNKHNALADQNATTNALIINKIDTFNDDIRDWYNNAANNTYATKKPKITLEIVASSLTGSINTMGADNTTTLAFPSPDLTVSTDYTEMPLCYRLTIIKNPTSETTAQGKLPTYWAFDIYAEYPISQTQIFRENSATYISKINATFSNNHVNLQHFTTSIYNDTPYTSILNGLTFVWHVYKLRLTK